MDKMTGFVDGLKACEKSIKGEIKEGKDRDVVKSHIQKAIEHLKQMTLHSHTLEDEISIDSRLISKTVFICHDIISHTGPMLGDDTLLFINAFCTMLSKYVNR